MKNKLQFSIISLFIIMNFNFQCLAQQWGGSTNLTGIIYRTGNIGIGKTNPVAGIHVVASNKTALILEHNSTSQYSYGAQINITSSDANVRSTTKAFSISKSYGGYQELFTVWGNGTVNAKTLYAEKIEVRTDAMGITIPDYVFEKNYNLRTLNSVEDFINVNKHLPEVPSAKEMHVNGMNLGEMNAILLKKIEELTLYVIDLQKQVNELK